MQTEPSEEEMLRSFEAFMLSSSKKQNDNTGSHNTTPQKKGHRNKHTHTIDNEPKTPPSQLEHEKFFAQTAKLEKIGWHNFHHFCMSVQNKWIYIDSQTMDVLSSIENLQNRIPIQIRHLSEFDDISGRRKFSVKKTFLTKDDIHLALSHDLLQHEKMISMLRKLMSDLSEALRMIGRQLDEALQHHLRTLHFLAQNHTCVSSSSKDKIHWDASSSSSSLMDDMNELFLMLSRELFRKQNLFLLVLDSYHDGKLKVDTDMNVSPTLRDSVTISTICNEWSKEFPFSCIDVQRIDEIMGRSKIKL